MRHVVTAGFFFIALLCIAAAGAIIWRAATQSDEPLARAAITADFVAQCQTQKPDCTSYVDDAMKWALAHGRLTKDCLARRPRSGVMARGTIIWLNAHTELHPLPVEQGIAKAADAIWPCRR